MGVKRGLDLTLYRNTGTHPAVWDYIGNVKTGPQRTMGEGDASASQRREDA